MGSTHIIAEDPSGCESQQEQCSVEMEKWKVILNEWDLSQYIPQFEEHGWTDILDWKTMQNGDLALMGLKNGHIARFNRKMHSQGPQTAEELKLTKRRRQVQYPDPSEDAFEKI